MITAPEILARFARLPAPMRGAALMVAAAASFAVMLAVVRHASTEVHPFVTAFFRNLLGLAFMAPWVLKSGRTGLRTKRPGMHLFRSLSGLVAMLSLFTAVSLLPLAEVTALTFTMPLFATAGAALVLGEVVRLRRWTATVVGFVGVLVILRPGSEVFQPASLLALAAALFMAVALLSVKSLTRTERPEAVVVIMGLQMTPLSLIPALFVWTTPSLSMLGWFVVMGLAATAGQLFMTRAFLEADASYVLPFDFARLVFVAVLGLAFFGERPDVWTWVGAGVIFAATVYIARRESRVRAERSPDA